MGNPRAATTPWQAGRRHWSTALNGRASNVLIASAVAQHSMQATAVTVSNTMTRSLEMLRRLLTVRSSA